MHVAGLSVAWCGGQDICPDDLYENSVPVVFGSENPDAVYSMPRSLVEHAAVSAPQGYNRGVAGSNPARGATKSPVTATFAGLFYFILFL